MIHIDRKEACCGCHACAQICPKHCITMEEDAEGFRYPHVDRELCVDCGLCEKVCPVLNAGTQESSGVPEAYASRHRREDVRRNSSSGGVFSALAEKILKEQGIVYGAAMTSADEVRHIRVEDVSQLHLLRGSKYIQSNIGQAYLQAREDLNSGKTVLFTGTPCQIGGLRSFLGKDYPNLICMDIICHGVPSPMVWKAYVQYREDRAKSTAVRTAFRDKRYGWRDYAVTMEFANGKTYVNSFSEDLFMQVYLRDLCLRPSCYECGFKQYSRVSDLTAADFWGIENVCPQMDDDKGTSLLLIHSEKGNRILRELIEDIEYQQVDFWKAIQKNPSAVTAVKRPEAREAFLRDVHTMSFRNAVGRYVKRKRSVKRTVKTALRKLGFRL